MTQTTAKDVDAVASARSAHVSKDVHRDIAFYITVDIGAAVETGEACVSGVVVNEDIAVGGCSGSAALVTALAATIDGAVQCVAADGEGCSVRGGTVDLAESRATVEVAVDCGAVERDADIAGGGGGRAQAAAKDISPVIRSTNSTTSKAHGDSTTHRAAGVASTVESAQYGTARHADSCSADASLITAAIYILADCTFLNVHCCCSV